MPGLPGERREEMTQPVLFDVPTVEPQEKDQEPKTDFTDTLKAGIIKAHKILSESTPHMINVHTNVEYYSTGSKLFGNLKRYKVTEFTATIKEPVI
jgi:hypothetical protein